MGAIYHLPVVTQVTYAEWLSYIKAQGISCFASALEREASSYYFVDYRHPTAVVFGNEGGGITSELLQTLSHIYIPMGGRAESLNVAASAAIILYEAFRQRQLPDSFQQR